MMTRSNQFTIAYETLAQELAALERMIQVFVQIFELDVPAQAKGVGDQVQALSAFYSWETMDESGGWPSLDQGFSELEQDAEDLLAQIHKLDQSVGELGQIYKELVLPQTIVILVSSLEVYLSTVFTLHLSSRLSLKDSAVSEIRRRYNFQNWGDVVKAYREFVDIELPPDGIEGSEIQALLQKRHVIVHQRGVIDRRAIDQLRLPSSSLGEHLTFEHTEVEKCINLVREIGEFLYGPAREVVDE
jgi:hypothetical protein